MIYCRRLTGKSIACELSVSACPAFQMHRTNERLMCLSPCNRLLLMRSPWQRENQCRQLPRQAHHLQPRQAPWLQMGHLQLQHQQMLLPMPHPTAPSLPRSAIRAQTAESERCSKCLHRGELAQTGAVAASGQPAAPLASAAVPAMAAPVLSSPTSVPLKQTCSVQQWLLALQAADHHRLCLP